MTTWTEQPGTSDTWEISGGQTIWDSGATLWDVSGNVEGTEWDVSATEYTTQAGTGATWTPV